MLIALAASICTFGAGSNFALEIFGNANMDDTIDEKDIKYLESIINGSSHTTEFADVNLDGEINQNDKELMEKIIEDDEEEITIIDDLGKTVTIRRPIERIILLQHNMCLYETLRALNVENKVIGCTDYFVNLSSNWDSSYVYFPKLAEAENIGSVSEPDKEKVVSLKPDVILTDGLAPSIDLSNELLGVPVISMDVRMNTLEKNTKKYGYIFDEREKADEYISWWKNWEQVLDESLAGLSDEDRPLVLLKTFNSPTTENYKIVGKSNMRADPIRKAGARNLGDYSAVNGTTFEPDLEWILKQNPSKILLITGNRYMGYDVHNTSEVEQLRESFMNNPKYSALDAAKSGNVYMISEFISIGGANGLLAAVYHAKQFHPDLFMDLDPTAVHQEYIDRFQDVHYDIKENNGTFVYPR
jgi:iron complex transport system substrate-binding protein